MAEIVKSADALKQERDEDKTEESVTVEKKETPKDYQEENSDHDKNTELSESKNSKRVSKRKQRFPTKQTMESMKTVNRDKLNKHNSNKKLDKKNSVGKSQRQGKSEVAVKSAIKTETEEVMPRRSSRTPKKKKMFDEHDEPDVKPPVKRSKTIGTKVSKINARVDNGSSVDTESESLKAGSANAKNENVKVVNAKTDKVIKGKASKKNQAENDKKKRDEEAELSSIEAEIEQIQSSESDIVIRNIAEVNNENEKVISVQEEITEIEKERVESIKEKGDADHHDVKIGKDEESETVESDSVTSREDKKGKENENVGKKKTKQFKKSFQCSVCEKMLSSPKALRRHKVQVHDDIKDCFECTDCEMVLKSKKAFERHRLIHSETSYKCNECNRTFVSHGKVKHHMKIAHEGTFFMKCQYENCDKVFSNASNRKKHIDAVHLNIRNHLCAYCPKTFKNSSALRVHLFSCHKEHFSNRPTFECETCHKVFTQRLKLRMHESVHTSIRPYTCKFEECGKTFRLKSNKIKHERVHENIRPYVCTLCGQRFSRRIYLETHQYKHTGVKQFKCTVCSKSFSQKGNLNIHMKIHSDERDFVSCEKCGKSFSNKSNLTKHKSSICYNYGNKKPDIQPRGIKSYQMNTEADTVILQQIDDALSKSNQSTNPISFILREVNDSETNDTVVIIRDENSEGKMMDKACGTDELKSLKYFPQMRNSASRVIKPKTINRSEIVTVNPAKPLTKSVGKALPPLLKYGNHNVIQAGQDVHDRSQVITLPSHVSQSGDHADHIIVHSSQSIDHPGQVVFHTSQAEDHAGQVVIETSQAGEQSREVVEQLGQMIDNVAETQTIYIEHPSADGVQIVTQQQIVEQIGEPVTVLTTAQHQGNETETGSNLADVVLPNSENVEYEIVSSGLDGIEEGILKEFLSKWNQQGTTSGTTVILDVQNREESEVTEMQGVVVPDSVQYIVTVKDQE